MRVAIYARYSDAKQDPRSIEDQISAARDHAARQGWTIVAAYSDQAISGESMVNRPGLQDMLRAAEARHFNAVVTESMDRLSREPADSQWLYRQLAYWGIPIITLADGVMDKVRVAVKGLVAGVFLDDLRQKVKRGQLGRVRAGRIPGGNSYGYDVVPGDDRGLRTINQAEADIVLRVHREYAGGRSPLQIVADLNREGIPSPRGGKWNASTLNGSRKRGTGILNNTLYIGRLKHERQRYVKDPATGKRQARLRLQSEWVEQDIPELRIIDDDLWHAVQARRTAAGTVRATHQRRPKRTLSGLLRCGICRGSYIVVQGDYTGCSAVKNKGTCDNRRVITMTEIENRVLAALQQHLLSPERVEIAVETYRKEREERAREHAKDRHAIERELGETRRKLARAMDAMLNAHDDVRNYMAQINELSAKERQLEAKLPLADKKVVAIHPQAARRYRAKVQEIQAALTKGDAAGQEAVQLVRSLIDRIVVTPEPERMGLEVFGDLAVLLGNKPGPDNNAIGGCGGLRQAQPQHRDLRSRAAFGPPAVGRGGERVCTGNSQPCSRKACGGARTRADSECYVAPCLSSGSASPRASRGGFAFSTPRSALTYAL